MEKSNNIREKNVSFANEFKQFTVGTTFHGIRYIFDSEYGYIRRMVWLILVLGMTSILIVMLIYSFLGFYNYSSVTSTSKFMARNITLPAITICPNNYMSIKQVQKLYHPQLAESILNGFQNTSNFNYDYFESNLSEILDQGIMKFNQNVAPKQIFVKCLIENIPVDCSVYLSYKFTDKGICHTFHSQEYIDEHHPLVAERPGHVFGVKFILDADPDDYGFSMVQGIGFHVLVHHQKVYPVMLAQGFVIGPGMAVYVSITKNDFHYLQKPYSDTDCVDDTNEHEYTKYSLGKHYSMGGCSSKCMDDSMYDCNCTLFSADEDSCTWRDYFTCAIYKISAISVNICDYCLPRCDEIKFEPKISSMSYPNILAKTYADYLGLPLKTKEEMNKRYVELNIYYETLRYTVTHQIPATTLGQLFSNFGGLMGLFLGASILTIVEFLDFACKFSMKMSHSNRGSHVT